MQLHVAASVLFFNEVTICSLEINQKAAQGESIHNEINNNLSASLLFCWNTLLLIDAGLVTLT